MPTPFDERRLIDIKAVEHLVDYLLERPIGGLAILTEAAEDVLLGVEERRQLIKSVGAKTRGKKELLLSVSAPATSEAIELVRLGESSGVTAVVLAPPRLPGFGYRELYRYVDRMVRSTALPVLIASRPDNALKSLLPEELDALIGHPNLKGVFAPQVLPSGVETWVKRFKGRPASVLAGCALNLSKYVKAGAQGAVCALACIAPNQSAEIWKAIKAGNDSKVEKLEVELAPVVELLGPPVPTETTHGVQRLATKIARRSLEGPSIPPTFPFAHIKEALKMQGHPLRPDVRPPFENLKPDVVEKTKVILQRAGVLS